MDDALRLLASCEGEAKILAGGQSLMPLLNFRMARPFLLVDVNRVQSLEFIREGPASSVEIGALTRLRDVERSPLLARVCPIMPAAASRIGHVQIRNRGTVGGSIAHADPAAELPLVLVALDGEVVVRSLRGARTVRGSEFFTGVWETALQPDELVEMIRIPALPPRTGWSFDEVTHRAGDFAVVGVAILLALSASDRIESCSVALSGAEARPIRLPHVEERLLGARPTGDLFLEAERDVERVESFRSDVRADGAYRRVVAAHLVRDGLARAAARARETAVLQ